MSYKKESFLSGDGVTLRKLFQIRHHETHFDNIFFLFPVSQIKTKTIQNKPFQHSMIFSWVFLMHKIWCSRFVWLSWWAQKSSLQGYYATVLPIKKWKKCSSYTARTVKWWSHSIIKSLFAIGRPSNKQRYHVWNTGLQKKWSGTAMIALNQRKLWINRGYITFQYVLKIIKFLLTKRNILT